MRTENAMLNCAVEPYDARRRQIAIGEQFGHVNAIPFSLWMRQNNVRRSMSVGHDCEQQHLLGKEPLVPDKRRRAADYFSLCVASFLAVLALFVFTAMAVTYYRIDSAMESVENAVAPNAAKMLASTMEMLEDSKATAKHFHHATEAGETLAIDSVPRLIESVNASAAMLQRLEKLLEHPVLQLSLEEK